MVLPFMEHHAKEYMVIDHFLQGMDNPVLIVQVAASGCHRLETMLRVAQSLEAVHEEER